MIFQKVKKDLLQDQKPQDTKISASPLSKKSNAGINIKKANEGEILDGIPVTQKDSVINKYNIEDILNTTENSESNEDTGRIVQYSNLSSLRCEEIVSNNKPNQFSEKMQNYIDELCEERLRALYMTDSPTVNTNQNQSQDDIRKNITCNKESLECNSNFENRIVEEDHSSHNISQNFPQNSSIKWDPNVQG